MKLSEFIPHQPDIRTFLPSSDLPSTRCVGVEIEVESARELFGKSLKYWQVINDSSLRNNGAELLCRQPLAGADLMNALDEAAGALATSDSVNVSERCSVHIHVDVRDLTTEQVGNILLAYVGAESALYKMGGKDRYDNIYCPGVSAALEQMRTMRQIIHGNVNNFSDACHGWCKYTGINLLSIMQRGSIEFRAHEGTLDMSRVRTWITVLLSLVEYAINKPDRESILSDLREGPREYATAVFGANAGMLLEDGIYAQYYDNNMTNVIDLLDDGKEYKPQRSKKAKASEESGGDIDSIVAQLNEMLEAS